MAEFSLSELETIIAQRAQSGDPDSWTAKLFARGMDKAAQKLGEEAVETVIASGGVGTLDHLVEGIRDGHATAVLAASIFHFGTYTIGEAKAHMAKAGLAVRLDSATG